MKSIFRANILVWACVALVSGFQVLVACVPPPGVEAAEEVRVEREQVWELKRIADALEELILINKIRVDRRCD